MLSQIRTELPGILRLVFPIVAGLAASTLIGVADAVMLAPLGAVPLAAVDRPWTGAAFAFSAVLLNVPLNWLLIYGPGPFPALGLTGAGIASVLAESLSLAFAFAYWRSAPSMKRLRLRRSLDRVEIGAALREGAPLGALYVVESGSVTVATLLIGAFGTVALAGNQVAGTVGGVLYMVPLGVAGAVAIRVAQARGAGDPGALRPIALAALAVATCWLALAALALGLRGREIAAMITDDPAVIEVAAAMFLVFALFQLVDGVQSTMMGALRGLSDTAWPAGVSILAYWVLSLPLGWVLAHWGGFGAPGIWLGFLLGLIVAAVLLIWRFVGKSAEAMAG